ncbi:unnamed protein product [Durusdinium trenchii]|uniref:Proteasome assembly chaperone 3 n=1 Tax=Durusdinium trenchii TaxID=1381693 RepID=A0ABP0SYK9_9DINO
MAVSDAGTPCPAPTPDAAAMAVARPRISCSSCLCGGQVLHFHVMQLEGQIFLWIGGERLGLDDLHVATPTRFDALPSVASLRGEVDGHASGLAQKLSRRFGRMIFFSLNLPEEVQAETMLALQKESTRILTDLLDSPAEAAE